MNKKKKRLQRKKSQEHHQENKVGKAYVTIFEIHKTYNTKVQAHIKEKKVTIEHETEKLSEEKKDQEKLKAKEKEVSEEDSKEKRSKEKHDKDSGYEDSNSETKESKKGRKKIVKNQFNTIKDSFSPGTLLSVIRGFNKLQKDYVRKLSLLIENIVNSFPTNVRFNHLKNIMDEFYSDEEEGHEEEKQNDDDHNEDEEDEDEDEDDHDHDNEHENVEESQVINCIFYLYKGLDGNVHEGVGGEKHKVRAGDVRGDNGQVAGNNENICMEWMIMEWKNAREGKTGEHLQIVGGGKYEKINKEDVDSVDKTIENTITSIFGKTVEFLESQLLNDDEVNSIYEKTMELLNDHGVNSIYEKTMDDYKEKKERSQMSSYDLNISQMTPPHRRYMEDERITKEIPKPPKDAKKKKVDKEMKEKIEIEAMQKDENKYKIFNQHLID
ncbi:uncharacterized protein LOC111905975 [Lactuca sativa]|uniref:uncharacterized protein LOC111905975 n=1 Tax=Lactuca sativa TaxID=4236 RepID=UPI0022B00D0B|nr:uncharacterized protein LOC111905975 [Lactuca sativa]